MIPLWSSVRGLLQERIKLVEVTLATITSRGGLAGAKSEK